MSKPVKTALYAMLACFAALFVVSSFFLRAKYNYVVYGDRTVLEPQQLGPYLIALVLLLAAGFGLYRLTLRLNKYRPRIVIPAALAVSFGLQVAILFLFPRLPTDDSQTVLSLALAMLYDHDYSSLQHGGYLYMFPFNFSIVLYLKTLLAIFPDNYLTIKLFNVLFSLVTTLMVHFIHRELSGKRENDYGALVFAAVYVPPLLMSNLVYNDVIATAFLTSSVYGFLRFVRTGSMKPLLIGSALLAVGNYFRSIGAIVLIAVVLFIVLSLRRLGARKGIVAILTAAALFYAPGVAQNAALQAANIVQEPPTRNSAPVYMWLNMGLNQSTLGFWDNRQSYTIYQNEAGYNKAESVKLFKEEIARKLSDTSFGDLARFYYKKLVWVWTEGTYQSARYGIGNDGGGGAANRGRGAGGFLLGGYSYSTFATELFEGDSRATAGLLWLMYASNMLMYGFILVRLIGGIRKRSYPETLPVLVVLGFIGFYLLWEIKSRYLFPVYPLLIAMAYLGFKDVYGWMLGRRGKGRA